MGDTNSLGFGHFTDPNDPQLASAPETQTIKALEGAGVSVVVAAGNDYGVHQYQNQDGSITTVNAQVPDSSYPGIVATLDVGAVFCGLYLVALAVAWRAGVPFAWIAFGALLVVVPPFSGSFAADARFGLLALPAYWGLARLGRSRVVDYSIRLVSPPLLAAGVVSLVFWFP